MIQIASIKYDTRDNHRDIDMEYAKELAITIKDVGLIEPIVVRPTNLENPDGTFMVVAGFHRFVSIEDVLQMTEIPDEWITVRNVTREEARVLNLVENIQRKDMTLWQEALALRNTFDPESNIQNIRDATGKSYRWARARWGLWQLDETVHRAVEKGLLSAADISRLLDLDPEARDDAAAKMRLGGTQKVKSRLVQKRFVGRKRAHRMMSLVEEKSLPITVHQAIMWVSGDLTNEQLASQLEIDPSELRAVE